MLEAELRTREREILELRSENANLKGLADIYARSGHAGPVAVVGPVGGSLTSFAADTSLAKSLTLATGTGGRDDDGLPGDELLQVVIAPKDADGTAIKVPGHAVVTAFDITPEGRKVPIGRWDVTGEQLRKAWKGGLLGSGYFLPLRWDLPPAGERVRVTVRFTTTDGKEFEADRDVSVKPLPGVSRPLVLPTTPVPPAVMELPKPGTVLPPPTPLVPIPDFPK